MDVCCVSTLFFVWKSQRDVFFSGNRHNKNKCSIGARKVMCFIVVPLKKRSYLWKALFGKLILESSVQKAEFGFFAKLSLESSVRKAQFGSRAGEAET